MEIRELAEEWEIIKLLPPLKPKTGRARVYDRK